MREIAKLALGLGLMLIYLSTSVSANIIVFSYETNQIEAEYRDMPARFGAMVPPEGIQAILVSAEPTDGCLPLPKPPTLVINESMCWAILMSRGNCTFYEKVKHAQDADYHIAIVHNVGSDELEPMSEDKRGVPIDIIAVFVGERAGNHLRERYLYNNSYFIEVNNDYPFIIDNLLLPFAIVVGLCFLLMIGFMVGMVVKCLRDRRRARRLRLPYSSLKQIPSSKFHKGDPYETCAICLEDYIEGEKLRILPCSHAYHTKCIDPWLTRKRRVCPVCKRRVFAANEVPTPGSLSDSDTDSDADTRPLIRGQARTDWGTFSPTAEQLVRSMLQPVGDQSDQSRIRQASSQSRTGHPVGGDSASTSSSSSIPSETTLRELMQDLRHSLQYGAEGHLEREEDGEREGQEENAAGGEGGQDRGASISLPINANVDDYQELPSTVIAGTGQSDSEPPNTSAIRRLWQSWKR